MKKLIAILFPILALLCGCEDVGDDYRYPSVLTDYACLLTDDGGEPELLLLDNGGRYSISFTEEYRSSQSQLPTYRADTTYRVIGVYELGVDGVAYIYSMAPTLSVVPTPLRRGEVLCQDPVYLQSIWLSGGYMNMVIELKALNGRHGVGMVDTTPEGMCGKEFTFYHDAGGDVEAYRQKLYASIPLKPFDEELQRGDTLRLVLNLYDEGVTRLDFVM